MDKDNISEINNNSLQQTKENFHTKQNLSDIDIMKKNNFFQNEDSNKKNQSNIDDQCSKILTEEVNKQPIYSLSKENMLQNDGSKIDDINIKAELVFYQLEESFQNKYLKQFDLYNYQPNVDNQQDEGHLISNNINSKLIADELKQQFMTQGFSINQPNNTITIATNLNQIQEAKSSNQNQIVVINSVKQSPNDIMENDKRSSLTSSTSKLLGFNTNSEKSHKQSILNQNNLLESQFLLEEQKQQKSNSYKNSGLEISINTQHRNTVNQSPIMSPNHEVDVFNVEKKKERKWIVVKFEQLLDNKYFQILVNLFTIYALFGDDIRIICASTQQDIIFDILTICALVLFFSEILFSVISKDDYTCGFFFWLDVISTITLILDLQMVTNQLYGQNNSKSAAKATNAGRIGSRAGRVVRLVRLIRLVKLYKAAQQRAEKIKLNNLNQVQPNNVKKSTIQALQEQIMKNQSKNNQSESQKLLTKNKKRNTIIEIRAIHKDVVGDDEYKNETRVGKKLSELTTKKVIILVLFLIFIIPLFSAEYYYDKDRGYIYGFHFIGNLSQLYYNQQNSSINIINNNNSFVNKQIILTAYNEYIDQNVANDWPLVYFTSPSIYPNMSVWGNPNFSDDLRFDEIDKEIITVTQNGQDMNYVAVVDIRYSTKLSACFGIGRTIYVCIVLGFGALIFAKDANDLVLKPIERMIIKVNGIAKNPLSARDAKIIKADEKNNFETVDIENAIVKIGTLLALGFGDAGSEIIASNIGQGDINPMLPGKKKCAIFGFCDIRNFTDATEVLQEEVMVFVNTIGETVHSITDKYSGSANKNIGDAFLLVWKFHSDEIIYNDQGIIDVRRSRRSKNIADLALISFLKIIAGINKQPKILAYRKNTKLNARLPDYKVKMGFGLHIGWAIEGAIGSEYKIDASYLSPNVNMAARLEAATKQFGVPMLLSSEIHQKFSRKTQRICREIDRVTVKGSIQPIGLFIVDTDTSVLQPSKIKTLSKQEKNQRRIRNKETLQENLTNEDYKAHWFFDLDNSLKLMLHKCGGQLHQTFNLAFQHYIAGEWGACKSKLDECFVIDSEDGPSINIYQVIKSHNFVAPSDWKGYRELTEK